MAINVPSFSLAPANASTSSLIRTFCSSMWFPGSSEHIWTAATSFSRIWHRLTRARTIQQFLKETMTEFWTPGNWPPYLPDLNLLDFSIWSILQEKVQATPHTSLAALRWSITRQWNRVLLAYVRRTCRSFRRRLEAIMAKNSSYIE